MAISQTSCCAAGPNLRMILRKLRFFFASTAARLASLYLTSRGGNGSGTLTSGLHQQLSPSAASLSRVSRTYKEAESCKGRERIIDIVTMCDFY